MAIKIGDTVRFLNATGGGKVTKIEQKNNLVYVEDADGFEIPVLAQECVVVGAVNESTNFPRKETQPKNEEIIPQISFSKEIKIEEELPIIETEEGENLNVLLAFFPNSIKQLSETDYDCILINDSNYFLFYNFEIGEKEHRKSIANGLMEPNYQDSIATVAKQKLNDWENIRVQIIPFKKDKIYAEKKSLDFMLKLNTVKFYKLHSFTENDYFDEPCMLLNLTEQEQKKQLAQINPEDLKRAIVEKKQSENLNKKLHFSPTSKTKNDIIEIDLHIHQLLDTTVGLTNADMLQHQLDVVKKTIEENRNKKGQKIVFIHGKGEGVLRSEIEKMLKLKYKNFPFQDASFKEYGFGATMVTIR